MSGIRWSRLALFVLGCAALAFGTGFFLALVIHGWALTCPLCRDIVDRGSLGWINRRALLVGCTSCAARAATWS